MPIRWCTLLSLALEFGCARAPRAAPVLAAAPSCVITEPDVEPGDTIPILAGEPIDPAHAPLPTNDAESLIFRQLYETLVRVDCDGRAIPGLATSWRNDGLEWSFTLRPNAAFADGSPVDATTVYEAWHTTDGRSAVAGVRSEGQMLTVFLSTAQPVTYFADPTLRLVRPTPESPWRQGTATWTRQSAAVGAHSLVLAGAAVPGAGLLRFDARTGADPRDLLDAGTAILVTRDPAAVTYAASLPGWAVAPLTWDRAYLLVSPVAGAPDSAALPRIRSELARDVVRGDARPADAGLESWLGRCIVSNDSGPPNGGTVGRRRVVYPRDDAVARRLAERLVARAETDLSAVLGMPAVLPGGTVTAAGLAPDALDHALAERTDWAVLLPVFHSGSASCAPLSRAGEGWGAVVPLIETRPHALVRCGAARVLRDRDGLVIEPARRRP